MNFVSSEHLDWAMAGAQETRYSAHPLDVTSPSNNDVIVTAPGSGGGPGGGTGGGGGGGGSGGGGGGGGDGYSTNANAFASSQEVIVTANPDSSVQGYYGAGHNLLASIFQAGEANPGQLIDAGKGRTVTLDQILAVAKTTEFEFTTDLNSTGSNGAQTNFGGTRPDGSTIEGSLSHPVIGINADSTNLQNYLKDAAGPAAAESYIVAHEFGHAVAGELGLGFDEPTANTIGRALTNYFGLPNINDANGGFD